MLASGISIAMPINIVVTTSSFIFLGMSPSVPLTIICSSSTGKIDPKKTA